MNTAGKTAVTAVFLLLAAGCGHQAKVVTPPQAQAPVGPPSNMTYIPAMPPIPPPRVREVPLATEQSENTAPPPPPRRTTRRKPSPAKPVAVPEQADKPATTQTQTASNASSAPADASPIGQLSSTGEGVNTEGRHSIEQLITTTESGLNNIKRSLSSDEQLTATQIKTFLAKAKQALTENDLDGAQTLATKAKVLLDELTKK
jgi:hypothetical protein